MKKATLFSFAGLTVVSAVLLCVLPVAANAATPITMTVNFTSLQNQPNQLQLSDGSIVSNNSAFNLTNTSGGAIVDPALPTNVQRLVARRDNGRVEFFGHFNTTPVRIWGTITVNGANITSVLPYVSGLAAGT